MHRDYLACLAWLALGPSWCDAGGPPSPASSRPQLVPHGQVTMSTALSGLDGPSDITLSLAGLSNLHSLASQREARLCSITGPNTI